MAQHDKRFLERFEKLAPKSVDGVYSISLARYAKNKVALQFISDNSGLKTPANLLFDRLNQRNGEWWEAVTHRFYSNREGSYIISLSQAKKFVTKYQESTNGLF